MLNIKYFIVLLSFLTTNGSTADRLSPREKHNLYSGTAKLLNTVKKKIFDYDYYVNFDSANRDIKKGRSVQDDLYENNRNIFDLLNLLQKNYDTKLIQEREFAENKNKVRIYHVNNPEMLEKFHNVAKHPLNEYDHPSNEFTDLTRGH